MNAGISQRRRGAVSAPPRSAPFGARGARDLMNDEAPPSKDLLRWCWAVAFQ